MEENDFDMLTFNTNENFDEPIGEDSVEESEKEQDEITKLIGPCNKMSKKKIDELRMLANKYISEKQNYDYHKYNFSKKQMIATEEQYKIITANEKNDILVLACAGSGKSTTIVCRVKYLIDHGVDPSKIILTTFNVDACESLKIKIECLFGFIPNIMIGTFDSIACRFYHRYFRKEYFVGINEYTTELLKYLDTEDGKFLTHKFEHIIFDEFQDANEFQYKVIKKFYENGVKVTVIGDDAQNIYQWRGSDLKYILKATDYFPTIKTYFLSTNYRSSLEIIGMANTIIRNNKDNIVKPMLSHHGANNILPSVKYYYKLNYQSQDIVRTICMMLNNGNNLPEDIAIISRNNYPLKDIEEEFEKYNKEHHTNIRYISLITNEGCDIKPKVDSECVTLTTIHKAKGLEWKHVFFVSCDDETIPSNLDPVGIQEERRLFYVAVTRAKETLRMSFTKKTLTRFIGEISNTLYSFPNSNPKFFQYTDARFHKTETDLIKVLNLLKEDDIEKIRRDDIIPKVLPQTIKIHEGHNYNPEIDQKFLHSDFNNFIIRYVIRTVGDQKNNATCYNDLYAKSLVAVVTVSRSVYNTYNKYSNMIDKYLPTMKMSDSNAELVRKMIVQIDPYDKDNVVTILRFRLSMIEKYGEEYEALLIPDKFLPDEFIEELTVNYPTYSDTTNTTDKILQTVYKISLCENICDGRRRLIYQDAYEEFTGGNEPLFKDIRNNFAKNIASEDGFECIKYIKAQTLELESEIHILDEKNNTIIDIHCSNERECKLEWLLQLIGKVAILKWKNKDLNIKFAKVYNPMQGTLITFDISSWNKDVEFLKYLCDIRDVKYVPFTPKTGTKPIIPQIIVDKKDKNYGDILIANKLLEEYENKNEPKMEIKPILLNSKMEKSDIKHKFNNVIKPILNNVIKPIMTQAVKPITHKRDSLTLEYAEHIKILRELITKQMESDDNMNEILQKMRICLREVEVLSEIEKNKNLQPYYIVFDTETTGLPTMRNNPPAEKNLRAYDTARILQLSWACYDVSGKLIKLENHIIKPEGYKVDATHIHGITEEMAHNGEGFLSVMRIFYNDFKNIKCMFGHNVNFDINILKSEIIRRQKMLLLGAFDKIKKVCTMLLCKDIAQIPRKSGGGIKFPTQTELYQKIVGEAMEDAHNAKYDVLNLGKIVTTLIEKKLIDIEDM